jgi:hypothetical protein
MKNLAPGDSVEIGVTHEVLIGREKSWIKMGITSKVQPDEDADEAISRVSEIVNNKIMSIIEAAVQTVTDYEGK